MTEDKSKEDEWAEEVMSRNIEGLRQLAEEKSAEEMRKGRMYRKLREAYRKIFSSGEEEKVSTIEL
ncbi:MAG: hypothetical protein ABEK00_02915 [Candidatus Nanohaloarchaea archaeon]